MSGLRCESRIVRLRTVGNARKWVKPIGDLRETLKLVGAGLEILPLRRQVFHGEVWRVFGLGMPRSIEIRDFPYSESLPKRASNVYNGHRFGPSATRTG